MSEIMPIHLRVGGSVARKEALAAIAENKALLASKLSKNKGEYHVRFI